MFIITILFSGLFLPGIRSCYYCVYNGNWEPSTGWNEKYQEAFKDYANFSLAAAHILHALTIEGAMTSLNIRMPINNGIPAGNQDLSADESNAVFANVPSRPTGYLSPGLHGFVNFMNHVHNPDWALHGTKLFRLLHDYHMQEIMAVARKSADSFIGVSENICIGALDHANNGIEKALVVIFNAFKSQSPKPPSLQPLTWDDNGTIWEAYKAGLPFSIKEDQIKPMGLYTHCLMRKFRNTDQPIELDSCCESKTVGNINYTLVFAGKVVSQCHNSCIYTRKDKPGSQYCFADGQQKVQCLD